MSIHKLLLCWSLCTTDISCSWMHTVTWTKCHPWARENQVANSKCTSWQQPNIHTRTGTELGNKRLFLLMEPIETSLPHDSLTNLLHTGRNYMMGWAQRKLEINSFTTAWVGIDNISHTLPVFTKTKTCSLIHARLLGGICSARSDNTSRISNAWLYVRDMCMQGAKPFSLFGFPSPGEQ